MNLADTSTLLAKYGIDCFENPSSETAATADTPHWVGFACSSGSTVSAITALSDDTPINGLTDLTSLSGFIPCRFTSISGTGSFICVRAAPTD